MRRPCSVLTALGAAILVAGCSAGSAPAGSWTTVSGSPSPLSSGAASPSSSASAAASAAASSAAPSASVAASASASASASAVASPSASVAAGAIDPRDDGLDVTFGEFAIALEASAIRPGAVTFVIRNAGKLTHGFEMRIEGSSSGSGSGDQKIETETFRSGETITVETDLPVGIYEIECFVSNHDELGMKTTLEVRADAPMVEPPAVDGAAGTVEIIQFAFDPASIEVTAGTEVAWTNSDPAPHTVTADDGSFDSKQVDPAGTFAFAFATAGSFSYHCEIHPSMIGTVVVR